MLPVDGLLPGGGGGASGRVRNAPIMLVTFCHSAVSCGGGTPAGPGPGGTSCSYQNVIVEINYGDGNGWQTCWQGVAKVCV
jgi:hypothetical protein